MDRTVPLKISSARIVVALVAALFVAGSAVAVAQTAILTGKGVTQVKVSQFQESFLETTSEFQPPQDLPGVAPVTVTVPAGQKALVKLTLAAESVCLGGRGQGDNCRMFFQFKRGNGPRQEIKRANFDSSPLGIDGESHAMIATVGPLTAGTYTFFVQGAFNGAADQWVLNSGEFIAERIAA